MQLADHVANIAAKHEGGDPEVEPMLPTHRIFLITSVTRKKSSARAIGMTQKELHGKGRCGKSHSARFDGEWIVVHRRAEFA